MKTAVQLIRGMTLDQKSNARQAWSAICEGVDVAMAFEDAEQLQAIGLIKNLQKRRGRKGGYEFDFTDRLEDVVRIVQLEGALEVSHRNYSDLMDDYFKGVRKLVKHFLGSDEQLSGTDRSMPGKPNQNNLAASLPTKGTV
jgi:hypothetical protein